MARTRSIGSAPHNPTVVLSGMKKAAGPAKPVMGGNNAKEGGGFSGLGRDVSTGDPGGNPHKNRRDAVAGSYAGGSGMVNYGSRSATTASKAISAANQLGKHKSSDGTHVMTGKGRIIQD